MSAIERLRTILDRVGIKYENNNCPLAQMQRVSIPSNNKKKISIIQGPGSYGYEHDLLEIWLSGKEEPEGYKTIHEVLQLIVKRRLWK